MDSGFAISLGVGTAIAGTGLPDARVLFGLAYSPVHRGSRSERVIVLPDDEGHVGAVEVDDGKHKTLLDKAYATSEITRKAPEVKPATTTPRDALPPAIAAVAKTLPAPDRDDDGVPDAVDACPDRAGVASSEPLANGCPRVAEKIIVLPDEDGHVGGVEIDDGRGKTVLDRAYATAEVRAEGGVETAPASSSRALDRAIAAYASALPPPDADGDGIHDLEDACPDRAGVASKDPMRNGCPADTAERMIVVPDADGRVGAIEIGDGSGGAVLVLDTAYATAEVDRGGHAAAVTTSLPATAARATNHAVAALAAGLPILDADGDGISDDRDACPEQPVSARRIRCAMAARPARRKLSSFPTQTATSVRSRSPMARRPCSSTARSPPPTSPAACSLRSPPARPSRSFRDRRDRARDADR